MFRYFAGIIITGIVLGFYIWQQTQAVRLGYRVEEMKREADRWGQENASLKLKTERLNSLERLDQFAKDRKLVLPDEKSVIYLNP